MTENLAAAGCPLDITEAEERAETDVVAQREEALAKQLSEMRKRKRALVDPLQFEMSIQAQDLSGYVPSFGWEMSPPSQKQLDALEKYGIYPNEIENAGKAAMLLDRLNKRRMDGLSTPRSRYACWRIKGFLHVGEWTFQQASNMITRIAANGWRVPHSVNPGRNTRQNNPEFGMRNAEFQLSAVATYSDCIEFKSVPRSGTHSFRNS